MVSPVLLCEILLWRAVQSLSWEDIISRLRLRTVPAGYTYHAWKAGRSNYIHAHNLTDVNVFLYIDFSAGQDIKDEAIADKLRSILAQLEFSKTTKEYNQKGVAFCTHLHVPEIHLDTGYSWYEREDPAHVLKVRNPTKSNVTCIIIDMQSYVYMHMN